MDTAVQPAVIPTSNPDLAGELSAILTGAAVAPLADRAFLRVAGPDATRWLNGMVTNNIQSLRPGEGNYNFLLNAQGRILGDCTVYRNPAAEPATYLLETDASQIETIQQHLDKFIIMDDVELVQDQVGQGTLLIIGSQAPAHLKNNGVELEPFHLTRVRWRSAWISVVRCDWLGIPRYELSSDPETISALVNTLIAVGASLASPSIVESLRILSGTPRYGVDIRNTAAAHDLPQETGQERALHFSKGCYLGQEIVERIRSRGSVHRTFSGFELTGALPVAGTILSADGKAVGELTSVAAIPLAAGVVQLALGYIRREALERKLPLEYPGGTAAPVALPYAIP